MKTVLITGISRGIGKALAEKFLKKGYAVIGTSQSGESPIQHPWLDVLKLDLASSRSIAGAVRSLKTRAVKLDILINNAGVLLDFEEERIRDSILRETLDVNLIGTILFTEGMLPMLKKSGRVLFISSSNGIKERATDGRHTSYNVSKAGLNMYAQCLRHRTPRTMKISTVMPGLTDTRMGRLGERYPTVAPETIAELIFSFLNSASEEPFVIREKRRDGSYRLKRHRV